MDMKLARFEIVSEDEDSIVINIIGQEFYSPPMSKEDFHSMYVKDGEYYKLNFENEFFKKEYELQTKMHDHIHITTKIIKPLAILYFLVNKFLWDVSKKIFYKRFPGKTEDDYDSIILGVKDVAEINNIDPLF